ncbi:hypothetical protein GJ744_008866 [Endocarpon pusillum]|uniref:Uncharacterized protein n=1 Tax=Endocarpon pusillum TaxID=364733 RepID=A0A8H7AWG2_9EURO|nr:hypothetical protein GJ744_001325 [Endocarpon pusillum]KAF7513572.1 hypothetical protein GJ744_008866 [Endocarpon pusillum]
MHKMRNIQHHHHHPLLTFNVFEIYVPQTQLETNVYKLKVFMQQGSNIKRLQLKLVLIFVKFDMLLHILLHQPSV